MLQKIRQNLATILLVALPFHALLVTVGTRVLVGQNHAPLTLLAVWKEILVAVLLIVAIIEIIQSRQRFTVDVIDLCILGFFLLAGLLFFMHLPPTLHQFILGAKYDLLPLLILLIARRVSWSVVWLRRIQISIVAIGCVLVCYGLATLVLPDSFFHSIGYSPMHSLYIPTNSLAAFQYIQDTAIRRMQSTMSGPNQLGLWLLLPLGIVISHFFTDRKYRWLFVSAFMMIGLGIFLTYSRTAWLAAALIIVVGVVRCVSSRRLFPFIIGFGASLAILSILAIIFVPAVSIRIGSTRDHFLLPLRALETIIKHPQGIGIGTAGPASNATSEACVFLRPEDDPSWAKDQPNLCVFVGSKQVQPLGRSCHCPFLTEDWYLQIGVEMGIVGFALFVILTGMLLYWLSRRVHHESVFLIFLGVSMGALLLHAWEDVAVAYSVWLLVGVALAARD